MNKRARLLKI